MGLSRDAVLAELGIPQWRVRTGVIFPGLPEYSASDLSTMPEASIAPAVDVVPLPSDLCLYADAWTAAENELLERMLQAVRGLREGLRLECHALSGADVPARVLVRLDGQALPTPAAMVADPSLKRPVWAALQAAVASLD
ncbi:MAG: hypothetical protein AB1344_04160 [Pseudomonadota bacterium]